MKSFFQTYSVAAKFYDESHPPCCFSVKKSQNIFYIYCMDVFDSLRETESGKRFCLMCKIRLSQQKGLKYYAPPTTWAFVK